MSNLSRRTRTSSLGTGKTPVLQMYEMWHIMEAQRMGMSNMDIIREERKKYDLLWRKWIISYFWYEFVEIEE